MATKKVASKKEEKTVKTVIAKPEKILKDKEEKCECGCGCGCECKCKSNEWLLKSIFYSLICIIVFTAVTAVFTIILAVDYHNNGKNRNTNYSNSSSENGKGSGSNQGTEEQEYDVSMFTEVTADELINLYNGAEKSLIYIGRPTCGYCVAFLPTLQQAQEELGYKTYYYDISNVTNEEYDAITGLNDFMANNFGYTPMVIVVQNGQILSADGSGEGWVGYAEYDAFIEYLHGLGY